MIMMVDLNNQQSYWIVTACGVWGRRKGVILSAQAAGCYSFMVLIGPKAQLIVSQSHDSLDFHMPS